MLSCKETSLLMSMSRDRPLSWSERMGVRLHLWVCRQCRRYERQLAWLNGLAGRFAQAPEEMLDEATELSVEARKRLRRAIDAHRDDGTHRHPSE